MLDFSQLNDKQKTAVTTGLGPRLIVAGAGSGKTKVLTLRFAYLIEHFQMQPDRILAITFTNKAADEMKNRITKMLDNKINLKWVGTFHSICLKILREDINHLKRSNNFTILDDEDQISIIKEAYRNFDIDVKDFPYKNLINFVSKIKKHGFDKNDCFNERNWGLLSIKHNNDCSKKWRVYEHYMKVCHDSNYLDFDDMLILTNELLSNHPQVLQKWSNRFDYVLVDEFQDTNDEQYTLIKFLIQEHKNLFAVGDPDQMIYTWRGANEQIINQFAKNFINSEVIVLNKNYRSTQSILDCANNLIKNNTKRYQKDLYANRNEKSIPIYFNANNQEDESRWVCAKILDLINNKHVSYNEICILYRSNFLSRNIEQELIINNLPYVIFGGVRFYQRKEIKDILAYLKAIYLKDEMSIKRIINVPRRGVSINAIDIINTYALANKISFVEALVNFDEIDELSSSAKKGIKEFIELLGSIDYENKLIDIFNDLLDKTKYEDYLRSIDEFDRLKNIDELRLSIFKYQNDNPDNTFIDYLQETSLYSESDNQKKDAIALMTIHTAKGLEFKYVFIIGMNDGIFPSSKSINDENFEEERRIAYVAITRAKDGLYLSSYGGMNYMTNNINRPSRFLSEISYDLLHKDSLQIKSCFKNDDDWFDSKNKKSNYQDNYHNEQTNYRIGDKVIHTSYGEGTIMKVNGDLLEISFKPPFNRKTLVANHKALKRKIIFN